MTADAPVLIAGAGIGGLTLALALARRNIPAIVLERSPAPDPVGAGIQLSPNAGRVLDALGLGDRLDAAALRPASLRVLDGPSGKPIVDIPLGAAAESRYGAPYRVLHRADLHGVLLQAARERPSVELRFGSAVARVHDAAAPSLTVRDGDGIERTVRGRLIAGADGIRSAVARHLRLPAARPTGMTAWRAMVRTPNEPSACMRLWLNHRAHLVCYPIARGEASNLVLVLEQASNGDAVPRLDPAAWSRDVLMLVAQAASWSPWSIFSRPALPVGWTGPVTLLGDAAHPIPPFLAQGAALAIEDAFVLASRLAGAAAEQAARGYERERRPRWQRVRRAAERTGTIYHLGRPASLARDIGMRLVPAATRLAPYDWLFGWRPQP